MKVKTIKEKLIKDSGYRVYKKYKTIFEQEYNFPPNTSKQHREVVAHNLALSVLWDLGGETEFLVRGV